MSMEVGYHPQHKWLQTTMQFLMMLPHEGTISWKYMTPYIYIIYIIIIYIYNLNFLIHFSLDIHSASNNIV